MAMVAWAQASGERSHSNSNHLKVAIYSPWLDEHPKQALSRPTKK
jgi:hypothetical protein